MEDAEEAPTPRVRWDEIVPEIRKAIDTEIDYYLERFSDDAVLKRKNTGVLTLVAAGIDDTIAGALVAERLPGLPGLKELQFPNNLITDVGARAIAKAGGNFPDLVTLDLSQNLIGPDGARAIAKHASNFSNLAKLVLSNNPISAAGARAIAEHASSFSALTALLLGVNDIGDSGVQAIAEHASDFRELTWLDLTGNGIGDNGVRALAEHAAGFAKLARLGLGANQVGDAGARTLAENAKRFRVLDVLQLQQNRIGPEGARAIAEQAADFLELGNLGLSGCQIGSEGARAIAEHATKFSKLTHLYLSFCHIGDDGVRLLAKHIAQFPTLAFLDLNYNEITSVDAVIELVARGRKGGPSAGKLERIAISDNRLMTSNGRWIEMGGFSNWHGPVDEVLAILTASLDKAASFVFDVRVVLVGVGENGKSQLAGALSGKLAPGVEAGKYTRGFEFREYRPPALERAGVVVRLLDMGGQPEQFSLHYLLWERRRNAFLLVCDSLKNPGWDGNRIRYFLRAITHKLDPSAPEPTEDSVAPVVAVLTMGDQLQRGSTAHTVAQDIETEAKTLGIAVHVIDTPVDALGQTGIDAVHKAIDTAIRRISATATAPSFAAVRKRVTDEFGTCNVPKTDVHEMSIDRYRQLATDAGETNDAIATNCLGILHALGDVIWVRDHDTLKHRVINPHWAGKAMYLLLTDRSARAERGVIRERDWSSIVTDDRNGVIRELMKALKLMKEIHRDNDETGKTETCYLVPDLMAYAQSKHDWTRQSPVGVKTYKTFLWESVFLRFIGDHADEIDKDARWAFRDQVLLKRGDGETALVVADYESEPMAIRFYADPQDTTGRSEKYCKMLCRKLMTKDDPIDEWLRVGPDPIRWKERKTDDTRRDEAQKHLLLGVYFYGRQQFAQTILTWAAVGTAAASGLWLMVGMWNTPGATPTTQPTATESAAKVIFPAVALVFSIAAFFVNMLMERNRRHASESFKDFENYLFEGTCNDVEDEQEHLLEKASKRNQSVTLDDWFVKIDQLDLREIRYLAAALQELEFRRTEHGMSMVLWLIVGIGCLLTSVVVGYGLFDGGITETEVLLALFPLAGIGLAAGIQHLQAWRRFHDLYRQCAVAYELNRDDPNKLGTLSTRGKELFAAMQEARATYPPVAYRIYTRWLEYKNKRASRIIERINEGKPLERGSIG